MKTILYRQLGDFEMIQYNVFFTYHLLEVYNDQKTTSESTFHCDSI